MNVANSSQPWWPDSNCGVSGIPGAVQIHIQRSIVRNNDGPGVYLVGILASIEDSKFHNNAITGVYVLNGATASLKNVTASENAEGVRIEAAAGFVTRGQLDQVQIDHNILGCILATSSGNGQAFADVARSVVGFTTGSGLSAVSVGGLGVVLVNATSNIVSDNGTFGISATNTGATVMATANTVTRNGVGLSAAGGAQLFSALGNV